MADPTFRQEQWQHRFDPHIAPINQFIDELRRGGKWAPYVAPMYGGTAARLLSVLRDPGPMTQDDVGSGFLCMENDDPTAETICGLFQDAGIIGSDIVPWNMYPWYINRAPKGLELDEGIHPLKKMIALLPQLRVVMLHGGDAHSAWKRLEHTFPEIRSSRKIDVIKTYHTSRQAFWTPDPAERERRKQHLVDSFSRAAQILRGTTSAA